MSDAYIGMDMISTVKFSTEKSDKKNNIKKYWNLYVFFILHDQNSQKFTNKSILLIIDIIFLLTICNKVKKYKIKNNYFEKYLWIYININFRDF